VNQRTKLLLAPVAALALTWSVAACGSDDDASSDTATQATSEVTSEATTAMDGTTATTGSMADEMDGEMAGGEATVGDITVTGAWVREPAEGQTLSAGYGTITNNGDADVTLVGASVPFNATVEIHETTTDADGTMMMQEVPEGFVVPAGGSFTLEPGGPHIMLIDIDPADITGTIELTMIFDDGTEVTVGAPVKPLDMSDMGGDMGSDMTGTTMAG
jgi:copper(I)-binding protein